ncbi:hypothetical protein O9992_18465 [Vibrio lentus]|nr:hypothetical protein [Vibrio lentus]
MEYLKNNRDKMPERFSLCFENLDEYAAALMFFSSATLRRKIYNRNELAPVLVFTMVRA